ncbi:MAG: sugar ABC transporter permease [Acholeplasma sp.]|nr:sugar ABC transporter permease [Acholeplasma sp.]
MLKSKNKKKSISYEKWGYYFIAPFFIIYAIFGLLPMISTIRYSFYEFYSEGLNTIGPNFNGLNNYVSVLTGDFFLALKNTAIIWVMGFVPQIIVSLLLAVWFTNNRLKLKGTAFFKSVIYMPNLVMAAAFSMIFFMLFGQSGPIVTMLSSWGVIPEKFDFLGKVWESRSLMAIMNFLMWYGNTTILLMAGIMGIDQSLIEAAEVDGASSRQIFFRVTMPLLKPIFVYVVITSLIGGIQLYDIPQIITNGTGSPNRQNITLMMYLQTLIKGSNNYGMAGALSVLIFILTGTLSVFVFRSISKNELVSVKR